MNIRKATVEDYSAISVLFNQSDNFHSINEPYIYQHTFSDFRTADYISDLITNEQSIFLVLDNDEMIVGFLYAYFEVKGGLPIHKSRKYLVIDNICINKEEQNKGYGEKLLEYVVTTAKELQLSDIMLNVYSFNSHAISLYNKFGFKTLSQDMILKL